MGKKWLGIASVVTLMGVSATLARAQDTRRPVDPVTLQRAVADNPDFDIASLWQRMAIPTQLDTVYRKIGIKPLNSDATFDSCSNDCAAEITRANLDADPAEEVILKVYQRWGFCRFLVFKPSGTAAPVGWQFIGYADHDFARYYMPDYRVEVLGGKRYFVVAVQGASGTGVSLQYDRWYQIERTGLHEILSLPAKGRECPSLRSLCREFESKVTTRKDNAQGEEFGVEFKVRYTGNYFLVDEHRERELPLLSRSQHAIYVPPKDSESYRLAVQLSTVTMREIRTVFNIDTLTCKDFFAFNVEDLTKIASSGEAPIKEWLARYAQQCESLPERARLLNLLAR